MIYPLNYVLNFIYCKTIWPDQSSYGGRQAGTKSLKHSGSSGPLYINILYPAGHRKFIDGTAPQQGGQLLHILFSKMSKEKAGILILFHSLRLLKMQLNIVCMLSKLSNKLLWQGYVFIAVEDMNMMKMRPGTLRENKNKCFRPVKFKNFIWYGHKSNSATFCSAI